MKIGIVGIGGRMGREIAAAALERGHQVACGWDSPSSPNIGRPLRVLGIESEGLVLSLPAGVESVDVMIDFSSPEGTISAIDAAVGNNKPIVIGTTGHDDAGVEAIRAGAKKVPIVFSPNMSVGVNLMFELVKNVSKILDERYEIEIIEAHHHNKKDAPSGTAKRLWEVVKDARGLEEADCAYERKGNIGKRPARQVGMSVIRAGDIVGEHTVMFAAEGERIEITHRASSRQAFAKGAVSAAEFLLGKRDGLYTMRDVLGL